MKSLLEIPVVFWNNIVSGTDSWLHYQLDSTYSRHVALWQILIIIGVRRDTQGASTNVLHDIIVTSDVDRVDFREYFQSLWLFLDAQNSNVEHNMF